MRIVARAGLLAALLTGVVVASPAALAQGSVAVAPPRLLSDAAVPYPDGAEGDADVVLTLTIGVDGAVTAVTVEGEPREPFASAASRAARGWRYEPATRAGAPVAARIRVIVEFRAPPPPPPPPSIIDVPPPAPPAPKPPPDRVEDVVVEGDRREASRTASLSRGEVRQIPGAFGDPFRAVETLPGVTPIVSGLPFFYIRGAPPGNAGYYLDGVRVPLLFHVGAGPSVIHPALVDRVDLYPGGYPARYGRFAGGIIAGETTKPSKELHGEYSARAIDAGALVEGPLPGERGTVLVSGRYSYTAFLLSQLSPDVALDYWDYQARVTYDLGPKDQVAVFAFGAYDYLGQRTATETITLFGTEFHRVDVRYDKDLGGGARARVAATVGLDRSRLPSDRFLRDRMAATRSEVTMPIGGGAVLRLGSDVQIDRYDVELADGELSPAQAQAASLFPTRTDLAMGGRADVIVPLGRRVEVVPGARIDYFASEGATGVGFDPRVGIKATLHERLKMLSAMGIAHQPPAFVLPLPGFQPGGLKGGLQKAAQQSLGLELDLGSETIATVTGFHNAFFDMSDPLGVTQREPAGCPPGSFPSDTLAGDPMRQPTGNSGPCGTPRFRPGTLGSDRAGGGGQAAQSNNDQRNANAIEVRTLGASYGLELYVKKKLTSRVGGFLSYTLSRSTRAVGDQSFVASFDRTHVANAALAFDVGKGVRAGARVVFYTGLPKAPDPTDPSTRLPAFFRLDLRLEKKWQWKNAWISVVAEWLNATLSKEVLSTRCTLQGCESQTIGPVTVPSLGFEGGF